MTPKQKAWLDAHPEHQPIGQAGGLAVYTQRGTLKADGTFVPATVARVSSADGAFGVGVREVREPGRVKGPKL